MKKTKILASVLFSVLMIGSTLSASIISANAAGVQSKEVGVSEFDYNFLGNKEIEIRSYLGEEKVIEIPSEIDGYTVTGIADYAIIGMFAEEIIFPDTLNHIGYMALDMTPWYKNQPDGEVYAGKVFHSYKGDVPENTVINIKEGTKGIATLAFGSSDNIVEINIPESVEKIGRLPCRHTDTVKAINVDENNKNYTSVDGVLFDKDMTTLLYYPCDKADKSYVIPEGVTHIAESAFEFSDNLENITFPKSLESIERNAFANCTALNEIILYDNVSTIKEEAFKDCTSVKKLRLSNKLTSINYAAFSGLASLEALDIPVGITSISSGAFSDCSALTSLTLPETLKRIQSAAFDDAISLKSVIIPNSVTYIEDYAFGFYGNDKVEGFVMYGSAGSEAEIYAKEYGLTFAVLEVKNDINKDGFADVRDVTALQMHLAGYETDVNEDILDINSDKKVDVMDVTTLQMYLVGS